MQPTLLVPPRHRLSLGCVALGAFFLGLMVYAVERDATRLGVVPAAWSLSAGHAGWPLVLRNSFPSFAHAYSFALVGCVWLACSWRQALSIGLALWGIEATLEILQHQPLHEWAGTPAWVRLLLVSNFDFNDLFAAGAGVLAAWGTLALGSRRPPAGTTP